MATDRRFKLLKAEIALTDLSAGGAAGDLLQYDGSNWTAATTLTGAYTWTGNQTFNTGTVTFSGTTTVPAATVTAHEASIDHDALLNFVAAEHLDWSQDQGATDLHDNNIAQTGVTQHEAALTILESQITDGSILARVASAETISGAYTFSTAPTLNNDLSLLGKNAAGSATYNIGKINASDECELGVNTQDTRIRSGSAFTITLGSSNEGAVAGAENGALSLYYNGVVEARTADSDVDGAGFEAKDMGGVQRLVERERVRNVQSNAGAHSYTLVAGDNGKFIEKQGAGAFTLTIPPEASVNFPLGTRIEIIRVTSSGTIAVNQGSGVTNRYRDGTGAASGTGNRTFSGTYIGMVIVLLKRNSDDWLVWEATI